MTFDYDLCVSLLSTYYVRYKHQPLGVRLNLIGIDDDMCLCRLLGLGFTSEGLFVLSTDLASRLSTIHYCPLAWYLESRRCFKRDFNHDLILRLLTPAFPALNATLHIP